MKSSNVIIRFDEFSSRNKYDLRRIEGTATPDSIVRLIDSADLQANPRKSKIGEVTDEIQESLANSPRWFHFKSKGLLLSTANVKELERHRFELTFEDPEIEGVLDGGHNLLAIAIFILRKALQEDDAARVLKKIKRWDDLPPIWSQYREEIESAKAALDFLTPVEIVYPQDGAHGLATFQEAILEVAQARNNNAELTEETKANKAGFYDEIKNSLDPLLRDQTEWKTNDGGRIKARDFVALAWIPLSQISEPLPGLASFRAPLIYNSKAECVNLFNQLMESDEVSVKNGASRKLTHPAVKSALSLLKDIPRLYDLIYQEFPRAYNSISPGFGRIGSVSFWEPSKKGDKYLKRQPKTKFYREPTDFDFPDGFIMPLVWALSELISREGDTFAWSVNPDEFIRKNLKSVMKVYQGMVSLADFDSQKVGKTASIYELAQNEFRNLLRQ